MCLSSAACSNSTLPFGTRLTKSTASYSFHWGFKSAPSSRHHGPTHAPTSRSLKHTHPRSASPSLAPSLSPSIPNSYANLRTRPWPPTFHSLVRLSSLLPLHHVWAGPANRVQWWLHVIVAARGVNPPVRCGAGQESDRPVQLEAPKHAGNQVERHAAVRIGCSARERGATGSSRGGGHRRARVLRRGR